MGCQKPKPEEIHATRTGHSLVLFFLVLLLYNANLRPLSSGDCVPNRLLPISIVSEFDLNLDEFEFPADGSLDYVLIRSKGHIYSVYPPTLPVIISPLYVPVVYYLHSIGGTLSPSRLRDVTWEIAKVMEKLSSSLIASLSVLFLYLALLEICRRRTALWLTLLYAVGTSTWAIGSQALWQHGLSELSLCLMVYGFLKSRYNDRWLALAGLAAGLAVATRVSNFLFALTGLIYVWQRRRSAVPVYMGFPAIAAALIVAYNVYSFGNVTGYYGKVGSFDVFRDLFLNTNVAGLAGLLLSPSRGWLIYSPFAVFSIIGALLLWRSENIPILKYMTIPFAGHIAFYSSFKMWWGGHCYGPRYLTDVAPFLCLFLVPILPLLKRKGIREIFAIAALFSVFVQVVGAFYYPAGLWDALPTNVDKHPERVWDWRDTQILRSLRCGPASIKLPSALK